MKKIGDDLQRISNKVKKRERIIVNLGIQLYNEYEKLISSTKFIY